MDNLFNINFPIKDSNKGYFVDLTTNQSDGFIADIKYILLSVKNDRYYRPNFGANLRKYLFDPNDEITFADIKGELQAIISQYFPNTTITSIEKYVGEEPSELFNKDYRGNKTSTNSPSIDNTIKIRITLKVSEGTFSTTEIIDLQI